MIRAGVFIGVARSGDLTALQDAVGGARRMHRWALAQGMPADTHAKLITDESGERVTPERVYDAVHGIVSHGAGVDQLILYFAGHGVNINRSEQWLLSDAPVRANAAINVTGSVELARYCGIGHVVVISDACRVAAEGIQAQSVRGQEIFPNEAASDRARPVDQFFACLLGKPSAEIRDPLASANTYRALYTSALAEALEGGCPAMFEASSDSSDPALYLKPVPLEAYLEAEIPRRIIEARLVGRLNQDPDAIIIAHPHWISRIIPSLTRGPMDGGRRPGGPSPLPIPPRTTAAPELPVRRSASLTKTIIERIGGIRPEIDARSFARAIVAGQSTSFSARPGAEAEVLARMPELARPFGPEQFETHCGIKLRGARVVDAFGSHVNTEILGAEGVIVRVDLQDRPAASILVQFDGGTATVIPALRDFVAAVTVENHEVVDVAYEPSANTIRHRDWMHDQDELRALRTLAAAAANQGRFRLDGTDAPAIARRMQMAKGVDPTLSVYAAYAYHELQARDRLREMAQFQQKDLNVRLFDVALLARELVGVAAAPNRHIVPFVPLLAQGWTLLKATRFRLYPALSELQNTLRESLWSLYSDEGAALLRAALASGDVL